jgi:hypothetical protein
MFKPLAIAGAALAAAGCGDYVQDQGRAPVQVVINSLTASGSGTAGGGGQSSTILLSDVVTRLRDDDPASCTVLNDTGSVSMSLVAKNPTTPGGPSTLNSVTITRYRVEYFRTDRPNAVQGVDVPYSWDSGVTVTIPAGGSASAGINLVRHVAKSEPPLANLRNSNVLLSMVVRVTLYGLDQAGNEVVVSGNIDGTFGDFGASC